MRRRSAIVPSLVLSASFAGVVPLCAVTSCSGNDPILNVRPPIYYGVAAVAYCCFEGGVADVSFIPDASDAPNESDAPKESAADAPSDSPEGG